MAKAELKPQPRAVYRDRTVMISATTLAVVTSLIAVIVAYYYLAIIPEIYPTKTRASGLDSFFFSVENSSSLFNMRNVSLICRLDRGVFVNDDGAQLIVPSNPSQRPPIIAEKHGVTLKPGARVDFDCNETRAIRNPKFSEQFKSFRSAQVHIEIIYHTLMIIDWKRVYSSHKFRRSEATGFAWVAD